MRENENSIFEMKLPELNTFVYEWYEKTHKPVEIKFHRGNVQDYGSIWYFHNGKYRLKEGSYSIEDWF